MPRRPNPVPAYTLHKPSGNARVRIDGRDFYLGAFGSEESRRKYGELLARHSAGPPATRPVDPLAPSGGDDPGPSVAEVALAFTRHAEQHYRKRGRLTSEVAAYRSIIGILTELFGLTPLKDFGPACLKVCRAQMIELGWVRSSVNRGVGRIRHVVKWAVAEELVGPQVLTGLTAVAPLRIGRSVAHEAEAVTPVADALVDQTIPHLPALVADMVRVQRLTGMRPGEVCGMTWDEVDTSGDVWLFRPTDHKLLHHGKARVVAIGPAAQAVLLRHRRLTGPVFPGRGGAFTTAAYRRAITRACEVVFGMPESLHNPDPELDADALALVNRKAAKWREAHCWHPNQLRHRFATELRKTAGLDAVAAALGHTQLRTTQVYAELDLATAVAAAAKCG
jgi:integrase